MKGACLLVSILLVGSIATEFRWELQLSADMQSHGLLNVTAVSGRVDLLAPSGSVPNHTGWDRSADANTPMLINTTGATAPEVLLALEFVPESPISGCLPLHHTACPCIRQPMPAPRSLPLHHTPAHAPHSLPMHHKACHFITQVAPASHSLPLHHTACHCITQLAPASRCRAKLCDAGAGCVICLHECISSLGWCWGQHGKCTLWDPNAIRCASWGQVRDANWRRWRYSSGARINALRVVPCLGSDSSYKRVSNTFGVFHGLALGPVLGQG